MENVAQSTAQINSQRIASEMINRVESAKLAPSATDSCIEVLRPSLVRLKRPQ
jgi:hypothetical protein